MMATGDRWQLKWCLPLGVFVYPPTADVDGDGKEKLLLLDTHGHLSA